MKRAIGYVKATREYGILYQPSKKPLQLEAMSDALFNSTDSGRSWLAHAIAINGAIWSWRSQVSKLIADSPPMAETLAAHQCLHNILWERTLLQHLNITPNRPLPLYTDSQTMMKIMKEPKSDKQISTFRSQTLQLTRKSTSTHHRHRLRQHQR